MVGFVSGMRLLLVVVGFVDFQSREKLNLLIFQLVKFFFQLLSFILLLSVTLPFDLTDHFWRLVYA